MVPDCLELIRMQDHQEVPIELASAQTNYLTPFLRSVVAFGVTCALQVSKKPENIRSLVMSRKAEKKEAGRYTRNLEGPSRE